MASVEIGTKPLTARDIATLLRLRWTRRGTTVLRSPDPPVPVDAVLVSSAAIREMKARRWTSSANDGKERLYPPGVKPPARVVRRPGDQALFTRDEELFGLHFRSRNQNIEISQAILGSPRLRMSTDEVAQISVEVADPGLAILSSGLVRPGILATYQDLRLVCVQMTVGPGPAGTGGLSLVLRSEAVRNLKRRRGPLVMRRVSPSAFVQAECKAVGARALVQPSATRPSIARDVPEAGQRDQGADAPSSWTTFRRLADELGFLCFEDGTGLVHFGQPSWLLSKLGTVDVGWLNESEGTRSSTVPSVSFSEDAPYEKAASFSVPHTRAAEMRTGRAVNLRGIPAPFAGKYLISSVDSALSGVTPIDVEAVVPRNPVPQPPDAGGTTTSGTTTPSGLPVNAGGNGSALLFTSKALSQAGDTYRYGAEASGSDPNPSAFDCSELVEWAAAQAGVRFVDGSANQMAAMRRAGTTMSVEQAKRTRGALLWKPGHIGISLGDGRTIEARNSRVGVVIGGAGDIRWVEGGRIPGMRY